MGDITNAEKKFKDAIRIKFNAPEAHYNLASLYGNAGKAIQASEEFDISEKLYRKNIFLNLKKIKVFQMALH